MRDPSPHSTVVHSARLHGRHRLKEKRLINLSGMSVTEKTVAAQEQGDGRRLVTAKLEVLSQYPDDLRRTLCVSDPSLKSGRTICLRTRCHQDDAPPSRTRKTRIVTTFLS